MWLQQNFNGSKFTITPLVMKYIAEILPQFNYDKNKVIKHMVELCSQYKPIPRKSIGKKVNDDELKSIIEKIGWDKSKSFIHNNITSQGYACGIRRLNQMLYERSVI